VRRSAAQAAAQDEVTVLDRQGRPIGRHAALPLPPAHVPAQPFQPRDTLLLVMAVGLAAVAVIGVGGLVLYVLLRRSERAYAANTPPPPAARTTEPMADAGWQYEPAPALLGPAEPRPAGPEPEMEPPERTAPSLVSRSFRLPALTDPDSGAVRIGQATDVEYTAIVRTIGPAGEWAAVSQNPSELTQPDLTTFPVGDILTLPSGQWQKMRLLPRQVLYAKGSVDEVVVSVTLNERQAG